MKQDDLATSTESQRAELETVTAALERYPRLAKLLVFLSEKYFQQDVKEITEYNIATEVFGRAKMAFDSTDSVARVEMHRLRKWLKAYYETEGRDHAIQIVIPFRTYIPEFVPRGAGEERADLAESGAEAQINAAAEETLAAAREDSHGALGPRSWWKRLAGKPIYMVGAAVVLVGVALGAYRILERGPKSAAASASGNPAVATNPGAAANSVQVPLRMLAGYDGAPQIDSSGAQWDRDAYVQFGGTMRRGESPIDRTSDPMLFDHWRNGNFFYKIPLSGGPYELHLYFTATSEDLSSFGVFINDKLVLDGFDVNTDAGGANVADERVFRDVYPNKDGFLLINFTNQQGMPALNALELLPGIPHKQLPVRIVTQPTPLTDHLGQVWHPDTYFSNGHPREQRSDVAGTPDPALYSRERYGHFTYAIPVDTRDRYTLVLHFAELYFGSPADPSGGVGNRVFRVLCNGTTLLDNFDIYKEAGSLHALTKTFYHLRPSPQGKLNLTFEPIVNNATVSAIEVIDESE